MEFNDLTLARRSLRAYDPDRPVPEAVIRDLLGTALRAPSAANRQPWRLLVIRDPARLDAVHAAYPRDWFMAAPCVLAVTGVASEAWKRAFDGWSALETDLSILMTHVILAAADRGLGTCWIANFEPEVLRSALALGPEETVFGITPLGYPPAGAPAPKPTARRPESETLRWL